jgi:hypothetical protein
MSRAADEIRRALPNPRKLVAMLGADDGAKPQARNGVLIRCPIHAERTPSCSVTTGSDGTTRFKCFGCDATGDALTLIAAIRGINGRSGFAELLRAAAELAGRPELADLRDDGTGSTPPAPPPRLLTPERTYPPADEVAALWDACRPVSDDEQASFALVARLVDPDAVARLDLARAIPVGTRLPRWARYRGMSWLETGHRMLLPVYDHMGRRQSLRAWRVTTEGDSPKRLPPGGFKASGLVLANERGRAVLSGELRIFRLLITEGEPDTIVRSVVNPDEAIVGIVSGSWNDDFARRVPYGSEVIIRTHTDEAGDKYAATVAESVRGRAVVRRLAA